MKDIKNCKHERTYLNVVSMTLRFWVCPDCKEEMPPPKPEEEVEKEEDRIFTDPDGTRYILNRKTSTWEFYD